MFFQNKTFSWFFIAVLLVNIVAITYPSLAQNEDIDMRIKRQARRINSAVQKGFLDPKEATKLKANLQTISGQVDTARKQNGGKLKPAQLTKFDNDLNQSLNNIDTQAGAGRKVSAGSEALGPKWAQGQDGAQDPQKLRKQMKIQEKRQLKQYGQAMQQVQELQQQQYEKEMLQTLGKQRPEILKNKQNLEKVRENTGAN